MAFRTMATDGFNETPRRRINYQTCKFAFEFWTSLLQARRLLVRLQESLLIASHIMPLQYSNSSTIATFDNASELAEGTSRPISHSLISSRLVLHCWNQLETWKLAKSIKFCAQKWLPWHRHKSRFDMWSGVGPLPCILLCHAWRSSQLSKLIRLWVTGR